MLHHYDKIGLFSPSQLSEKGHRIYTETDIKKLQQVISLKQLRFSLEEIKQIIENLNFNPIEIIKVQLESVKKNIQIQMELCNRLEKIYELLNNQKDVSAEQFIHLIEVINMSIDNYFSKDQLENIKSQLESEKGKQFESEWLMIAEVIRAEYEKGTPPESLDLTQLENFWNKFVKMLSGGNPEITHAVERYYIENPGIEIQFGVDKQLSDYIMKALSRK